MPGKDNNTNTHTKDVRFKETWIPVLALYVYLHFAHDNWKHGPDGSGIRDLEYDGHASCLPEPPGGLAAANSGSAVGIRCILYRRNNLTQHTDENKEPLYLLDVSKSTAMSCETRERGKLP